MVSKKTISAIALLSAYLSLLAASSQAAQEQVKAWELLTTLEGSSSLHESNDPNRSAFYSLELNPKYNLSSESSIEALGTVMQDLALDHAITVRNTLITAVRSGIPLNPFIKWIPSVSGTIPTNEEARSGDSLRGALSAKSKLKFDFARLGLTGLNAGIKGALTQSFYEFETSRLGSSNSRQSISGTFNLGYDLNDRWSFGLTYIRSVGFTYEGSRKYNFDVNPSVGFTFNKFVSLELGLDTLGDAYKENGETSRVSTFDPNNTNVYSSLQLTL